MANPHRGEASFEAEGKTYRLHFTWNAAAEFEAATGLELSDALMNVARKKLSARSLRGMLWAGLREHHPEVSIEDAGRLMDVIGRSEATRLLGAGLRYYFPETDKDAPPDPPQPASA